MEEHKKIAEKYFAADGESFTARLMVVQLPEDEWGKYTLDDGKTWHRNVGPEYAGWVEIDHRPEGREVQECVWVCADNYGFTSTQFKEIFDEAIEEFKKNDLGRDPEEF